LFWVVFFFNGKFRKRNTKQFAVVKQIHGRNVLQIHLLLSGMYMSKHKKPVVSFLGHYYFERGAKNKKIGFFTMQIVFKFFVLSLCGFLGSFIFDCIAYNRVLSNHIETSFQTRFLLTSSTSQNPSQEPSNTQHHEEIVFGDFKFFLYLCFSIFFILLGGVVSGLNVGLMSIDPNKVKFC
jgi:hypothetical protein